MKKYHNPSYWNSIHDSSDTKGSLRSVGWPSLSEEFNIIKYRSEADTFNSIIETEFQGANELTFMEVGCGIGFFTEIVYEAADKAKIKIQMTCLDISKTALDIVSKKYPNARCIQRNLLDSTVDDGEKFNIVSALMVLLHLNDVQKYQEALINTAKMVKKNGILIIYEPLISKNYSPFLSLNYSQFIGNSYTHPKFYLDNILANMGFVNEQETSGASWMLNSPIQSSSKITFTIKNTVWKALYFFVYKRAIVTRIFSSLIYWVDRYLKNQRGADSGTFVVYRKIN